MVMLEGLLVDLVPFGKVYRELQHKWENSEAAFWGDMGDRQFFTREGLRRQQAEWLECDGPRDFVAFGIQTRPDAAEPARPIGGFFIGSIKPQHRHATLGQIIGEPDYWGGGYGTDALLLALDFAFEWLDLQRVWLLTMALNARVLRQMEKVGFAQEARRREATLADGVLYDVVQFGLLAHEWPGRLALIERLGLRAKR